MSDAPDAPDHSGHRERLRSRLLESGPDALADHELLEYLLMVAIPRIDTKPLAKKLIKEFGSLGGVLSADPQALTKIKGVRDTTAAAIKIAQALALRIHKQKAREGDILSNWQAVLDYLRADMAHHNKERVRALFLDARNRLIQDQLMSEGSVDEAAVYVREILKRAMELGAVAIILVHNHPSGDPTPSRADIDITRQLAEAGKRLNITVHDHVIMGTDGHSSLRSMGLM